jgi:hypothetical protein
LHARAAFFEEYLVPETLDGEPAADTILRCQLVSKVRGRVCG